MLPFLKWPGGKRWFIVHHANMLPTRFKRYIEPFLGGGSVYFHLCPQNAILTDTNEELIVAYTAIRDEWERVATLLRRYDREHDHARYYQIRDSRPTSLARRAARMIYLNRTCFNGIYRVNREGTFNVPIGTRTAVILPTDDFARTAGQLATADLRASDFELVIDEAGKGDFIFADPPYTVNHNNNGFIKYNEKLFSWEDQKRLAAALARARERGAIIVATNADHGSVRRLYWQHGFNLNTVERFSSISYTSDSRKQFKEVIIRANCGGERP